MKWTIFRLVSIILLISFLTGCSLLTIPQTADPSQSQTTRTTCAQTEESQPQVAQIDTRNTYWVAEQWTSLDGEGAEGLSALTPGLWDVDLILRSDGTAQFRDIQGGISLMEDADIHLSWDAQPDGTLLCYNRINSEPVLKCRQEADWLLVEYRMMTLYMKQQPMPQQPGALYAPAELEGTWLLTSTEIDGDQYEAMPWNMESIVFRLEYSDSVTMVADLERWDDELEDIYQQNVVRIPLPLHTSCDNQDWCVRIGPVSEVDAKGNPLEPERYATLLDRDTLLLQNCFTQDGTIGVSYQTFRRILPQTSRWQIEPHELENTGWKCAGFIGADGQQGTIPEEIGAFQIYFQEPGNCVLIRYVDGMETDLWLDWSLSNGGVIRLSGQETGDMTQWYCGAVRGYYSDPDSEAKAYEMFVCYEGGLLRMVRDNID